MQNTARNTEVFSSAYDHINQTHNNADGWVTLARKKKSGGYYQWHYRPQALAQHLAEWTGEDVYFSQNTFFKPQRRIDTVRELRSIYVDLDIYKINPPLTEEYAIGKLFELYIGHSMPIPNEIIHSGRGLVLVWFLEPISYKAMDQWQQVEDHFVDLLKEMGADQAVSDAARIFRLSGTINSKSQKLVTVEHLHDYRYDLSQLHYDYLPEPTPKPQTPKKAGVQEQKPKKTKQAAKPIKILNYHTLYFGRIRDIVKLIELRQGQMTGYREITLFLYRYFSCCFTHDPADALRQTLEINQMFTEPLPVNEATTATRSAEKAYNDKYDEASSKTGYNYRNSKLIGLLDITQEEMQHMEVLINQEEKKRRNRLYQEERRRAKGIIPNEQRKAQQQAQLEELIKNHPQATNRELAEKMQLSISTIKRLKAQTQ